jgi:beta-glucuronidase
MVLPRRRFLKNTSSALALLPGAFQAKDAETHSGAPSGETVSLCGRWLFRTDPQNVGEQQRWFSEGSDTTGGWTPVAVPHTWQIEPSLAAYRGVAWYRRLIDVPGVWANSCVRIEFEAVFHSARVWINGKLAGEHLRKGYTAFTLDLTPHLTWNQLNMITVRVDSAFDEHMLPRGQSSDWANDGGIFRPVQLLVTPKTYVDRLEIEGQPDLSNRNAKAEINVILHNASQQTSTGSRTVASLTIATGTES